MMGLEGIYHNQSAKHFIDSESQNMDSVLLDNCNRSLPTTVLLDLDNNQLPTDLIAQAQILLRRSKLYEEINQALLKTKVFQPLGSALLMTGLEDESQITNLYRDAAVNNLRFLNMFYGYQPSTFSLAANILDRLLSKVKANSKFLSCIATGCFFIAAKANERFPPNPCELVKLSQCGGSDQDLLNMERSILDKLEWQVKGVTPLQFVKLFYKLVMDEEDEEVINFLVSALQVLTCRHDITRFRMETFALALVSYKLQDLGILNSVDKFSTIVEAQFYCQIGDAEMLQCHALIKEYLELYERCPSRLPRLQLSWSISSRTLRKMKPSTKVLSDLAPIMEDEDDNGNDAGLFDSENDDSELERQIRLMRLKSQQPKMAVDQIKADTKMLNNNYLPLPRANVLTGSDMYEDDEA